MKIPDRSLIVFGEYAAGLPRLYCSALRDRPSSAIRTFSTNGARLLEESVPPILDNCIVKNFHVSNMKAVCVAIPSRHGCNFEKTVTE